MKNFSSLRDAMIAVKVEAEVKEAQRLKERSAGEWLVEGGEHTINKVKLTLENDTTRFNGDNIKKANWHIRSAVGTVFVHCRDRQKAQSLIDEVFGKGKYTIQSGGLYI